MIKIELDAKLIVVVDLLKKDGDISNGNDNIVAELRKASRKFQLSELFFCYREANKYFDALTRRGLFCLRIILPFLNHHLMYPFYLA